MDTTLAVLLALGAAMVAGGVSWRLGRGAGARPFEEGLQRLSRKLQDGETGDFSASPEGIRSVAGAVDGRWAPKSAFSEDSVKQAALWEALHRVSQHLASAVQRPLISASKGDAEGLREGVGEALGALEDIDFFLGASPEGLGDIDLGSAVRDVIADFADTSSARPKQRGPRRPVTVRGNDDALKDALFLILHNATQFGGGKPIDVVVRVEDGHGRVHVRDRGVGFTADALSKAYDPFYTTVEGNLGLGLAHARKIIEDSGGKIHLRNSERGGGEVEVALPLK